MKVGRYIDLLFLLPFAAAAAVVVAGGDLFCYRYVGNGYIVWWVKLSTRKRVINCNRKIAARPFPKASICRAKGQKPKV